MKELRVLPYFRLGGEARDLHHHRQSRQGEEQPAKCSTQSSGDLRRLSLAEAASQHQCR